MNILIINASPNRQNGGSFVASTFVEKALRELQPDITINTLFLSDINQPYCDGCLGCLKNGGDTCPVIDKVEPVESAIRAADGIILAAPVHSFNIGAQAKTMIDLLVKEIHRPSFFGKHVIVMATAMGGGQPGVLKYMRNTLSLWGMNVVAKIGVSSAQLGKPDYDQQLAVIAKKAAEKLHTAVTSNAPLTPKLIDLISFQIMRIAVLSSAEEGKLDYAYWQERNWLESDYFTNENINPLKNWLAKSIGKLVKRQIDSGKSRPSYAPG